MPAVLMTAGVMLFSFNYVWLSRIADDIGVVEAAIPARISRFMQAALPDGHLRCRIA